MFCVLIFLFSVFPEWNDNCEWCTLNRGKWDPSQSAIRIMYCKGCWLRKYIYYIYIELCACWQMPTRTRPTIKNLSLPRTKPAHFLPSPAHSCKSSARTRPAPALDKTQPAAGPRSARSWPAVSPHMNKFHYWKINGTGKKSFVLSNKYGITAIYYTWIHWE